MTYVLHINPGASDADYIVKTLGQNVILAKAVTATGGDSLAGGNTTNVGWVSFAPMANNAVSWEEQYTLYASLTTIEEGHTISQDTPLGGNADMGVYYDFDGAAFTRNSTQKPPSDTAYWVRNKSEGSVKKAYTFGLAQTSTMSAEGRDDGSSPLCAVTLGPGEQASFVPEERVSVFLDKYQNNGTVILHAWSNPCEVTLVDGTPVTLLFDRDSSSFYEKN
ncbi:hypothetical protein ACFV1L_13450 [Kitasatospora sp. NPDC059646]|uniref:hypothetical protein n=1 Tax=Kitasatospora sp. NPDC059646 TaxID=3346893 RepID=UPI0036D1FD1A